MTRFVSLVVASALLAGATIYQTVALWALWRAPVAIEAISSQGNGQRRAQAADRPSALTHAAIGAYQQTLTRPLFVDGRRPPAPKPVVIVQPVSQPLPQPQVSLDRYRLLGVHLDETARRALIETPAGARAWVRQGENLGEWTLIKVEADRAHLSAREHHGELRLYPARQGG